MIVPVLHCEKVLQVKDLTRFDASRSILVKGSADPINSVKIKLGASGPEIEVFNAQPKNWFVDYAFNDPGATEITLTVASASESASVTETINILTAEEDALFSGDADLISLESDIMKWLPNGRSSFLDLHRKSQSLIVDWVNRQGYRDDKGDKFTKAAFKDNSDVNLWSVYTTLKLFFMGVQNATDDVFKKKADYYHKLEIEARDRAILDLDMDGDGEVDKHEGPDIRSGRLFFR